MPPGRLADTPEVGDLLRRLAVPRLHGTPAADRVAAEIRDRLEAVGCVVEERPFTFSAWPGLHGPTAAGLAAIAALALAAWLLAAGMSLAAGIALLIPAIATAALVHWSDRLILSLPLAQRAGTNILATSPGSIPRFLVVAHRDSKSQPVPLVGRIGGAVAVIAAWVVLMALIAQGGGPSPAVMAAGIVGTLGGATLGLCRTGNGSDGALDNASGIAALLRMASIGTQNGVGDVAYLITDAEELGLAGARAEASSFPDIEVVINLDGLDDSGPVVLVEGRSLLPGSPNLLTHAINQSAARRGANVRHRGLPPGLLLDHLPFSRVGHTALTVMRGSLRSMARVHRPADTVERLAGTGSELVAAILTDALAEVRSAQRVASHSVYG